MCEFVWKVDRTSMCCDRTHASSVFSIIGHQLLVRQLKFVGEVALRDKGTIYTLMAMTILIRPIRDSKSVFDFNSRSGNFFYPEAGGWRKMTEEEEKEFSASNFAIGYCGNDIRLSTWSRKESRELHNLNFMQDAGIQEKRAYLWQLLQTDFQSLSREKRRESGYYALQQYRKIADVLRSGKTVTIWYLSGYDTETAELFKRFFEYLSRL